MWVIVELEQDEPVEVHGVFRTGAQAQMWAEMHLHNSWRAMEVSLRSEEGPYPNVT